MSAKTDAAIGNHNLNNKILDKLQQGIMGYVKRYGGILIGFITMCIALSILSPVFLTASNILNVLRQISTNAILAFGMTFAIIICGIDLSVGSVLALSGTLSAGLITLSGIPTPIAVLIGLTLGTLIGLLNGVIIAKTGLPAFIVTLCTMLMARGAAYVYTDGMPVRTIEESFNFIGNGYLGPIPLPIIYMAAFFVFTTILLNKTKFGRHVYAVGGNVDAAKFSGIDIQKVQIGVFTLLGFSSAFAGIVLCARMYSGQPTVGQGFEMDAIAASVLGGTSMSGGIGTIGGTMIGALIIGVLNNGLNILNVSSFWQSIIKGAVILTAVYVDSVKKRKEIK
ncbi:ribose ABC transporter permease [Defluviitalea raffinosedens]|uniref:Ribose ABC transporter permease n=2 Tax=Defluviitalea raffinosedens TaxID=1450156 RepID=A0A7C8LJZ8_9FIRM|nr:ribose ABC transporter permease [Defluviitalea raffinosedens]MBM7684376.1 ribose transport system permease protein [Defluviitalea raffinosedens]HHW67653.1 ribose ABC transporter permease [Candidatus Epulonipiscium sp.]